MPGFVTVSDIADELAVSEHLVVQRVRAGSLPTMQDGSKPFRTGLFEGNYTVWRWARVSGSGEFGADVVQDPPVEGSEGVVWVERGMAGRDDQECTGTR